MSAEAASPRTKQEVAPGIWLDGRLALYFQAEATLVVADLHWGYARSHRHRGSLVPLWGDDEIGERLTALLEDYQPRRMLWLGDSLHTVAGRREAEVFLDALPPSLEVRILGGNHDRRWKRVTDLSYQMGDTVFHHGDTPLPVSPGLVEMMGHYHPAVTWRDGAGLHLKLPALVQGATRWILPAFSPWAEGTDWTSELKTGETLWSISPRRIFPWKPSPAWGVPPFSR